MPLEDFLWMLMRESGYMEYASALPGGDRRAANLRALVDKAVAYSGSQGKGLFGFVRYVEALQPGTKWRQDRALKERGRKTPYGS